MRHNTTIPTDLEATRRRCLELAGPMPDAEAHHHYLLTLDPASLLARLRQLQHEYESKRFSSNSDAFERHRGRRHE